MIYVMSKMLFCVKENMMTKDTQRKKWWLDHKVNVQNEWHHEKWRLNGHKVMMMSCFRTWSCEMIYSREICDAKCQTNKFSSVSKKVELIYFSQNMVITSQRNCSWRRVINKIKMCHVKNSPLWIKET